MEMLLTPEQAAQALSVDVVTVRRWLRDGHLRGIKRRRLWRVPETALTELAENPKSVDETPAEVDALLDATAVAARRAGYQTDEDIERLIAEVRAELGHDGPRRALREADAGAGA